MTPQEALAKWRAENDKGNGYDPQRGDTVDDVVDSYDVDGARILHRPQTSDEIAVIRFRGETLGIGDANGPWECVLEQLFSDWHSLGTSAGESDRLELLREHGQVVRGPQNRDSALATYKADCLNYGFLRSDVPKDDREEYISAYVAALNRES